MKLFQLYPKALAHFACKSPVAKASGKRWDTETHTPQGNRRFRR